MIGPRLIDKPLVLYGFGKLGHLAEEIFNELKIPVLIWDKKLPCPVAQYPEDFLLAICVATEPYSQVIAPLIAAGWTDICPIWEIVSAYPQVGINNGWTIDKNDSFFRLFNNSGVAYVYERLYDEHSQCNYMDFLLWRRDHYEDIDGNWYPPKSREPLPSTLADIRQRQRVITFADTPLIRAVSIHAEGCELKTLEVNMHIFKKYRPSIECAVYHSRDGLWRIEKFLMDNLPDYRWTFRLHAYQGQAACIYGVPNERKRKEIICLQN